MDMNIDISQIDSLNKEQIEKIHDDIHIMFKKLLNGEKIHYTFRELHYIHFTVSNALIRAGGKHISPIDQLDKIQMLEDHGPKGMPEKEEIIVEGIKEFEPEDSTDQQLIEDHNLTHNWVEMISQGCIIKTKEGEILDCESIKEMHDKIVVELEEREIPHDSPIYCNGKEGKEEERKEEFILIEYLDLSGTAKNLWAIQLEEKIFELELNPLVADIVYSIKKNINKKGNVLDKGEFKILIDNENLLQVEFEGEKMKGIYNFKKNQEQSDIWILSAEGASEQLRERFGESLSNEEIGRISFLSSNKIGASEIANLMTRPVQTIYNWISKLANSKN